MAIRREPKNNWLGVHWTQWPWPHLVVRAIFRRFVPRPNDANSTYRRSVYHKLSIGYVFVCWAAFGTSMFYYFKSQGAEDNSKRSDSNIQLPINRYSIDDHTAQQFYSIRVKGFSVVESRDITEEVREGQRKRLAEKQAEKAKEE